MNELCDSLHLFADGELSDEEATAFRVHLASCPRCQAELHDVMQLQSAASTLTPLRAPVPPARPWYLRPRRVAALVLPLAAAALFAVVMRPANELALPAYTMRGPSGYVESVRGSTASAPPPEAPLFLPESTLEVQLIPSVPVAAGDAPAAGLFVEDAGKLLRVREASVRTTDQGAFAVRAGGRAMFGDRAGMKLVFTVVAPSARALDALAGAELAALKSPELRSSATSVEYRLSVD